MPERRVPINLTAVKQLGDQGCNHIHEIGGEIDGDTVRLLLKTNTSHDRAVWMDQQELEEVYSYIGALLTELRERTAS